MVKTSVFYKSCEGSFSQQVEQFFLTEDENDFGIKIPLLEDNMIKDTSILKLTMVER